VQGYGSDPVLWLYTDTGQLIAANDDWYGLQSNLDLIVSPGTYRLRAGFCCHDPNATRPGQVYGLQTSVASVTPNADPTTTVAESTTTSVEPSTTTQPPETTSTTDAPTTTLPETTSTETIPITTVPETTQPVVTEAPTTTGEPERQSEQVGTTIVDVSTTEEIPTTTQETTTTTNVVTTTTVQLTTILPTTSRPLPDPRPIATIPPTIALEPTTTTEPPTTSTTESLVATTLVGAEPITELPADIQNLTPEAKAELVEQLNDAPVELKREFEATVNVFGGGFDNYVPADQRVPVGTRRTLIAVTGALVTLSSTAPARRNRR